MTTPTVGPNVPRRGNRFTRWLGRYMFQRSGWTLVGEFPDVPKAIVIGVPHTSNMDGYYSIGAMMTLSLRLSIMAKDSMFSWYLGWFFRWLGFIPINRSESKGVVEQTIARFSEYEQLLLVVAPEGTRGGADKWKTGFYHIAHQAKVPIILGGIDYEKCELSFNGAFYTSDDMDADLNKLYEFYTGFTPGHAENSSGPLAERRRNLQNTSKEKAGEE